MNLFFVCFLSTVPDVDDQSSNSAMSNTTSQIGPSMQIPPNVDQQMQISLTPQSPPTIQIPPNANSTDDDISIPTTITRSESNTNLITSSDQSLFLCPDDDSVANLAGYSPVIQNNTADSVIESIYSGKNVIFTLISKYY